ncbi:restriction endonuclease subunit S [Psychrobacter sp. PAMC 21119]|uniref:restriction endonuclease subunit S n=1 Tax=Psychrobacter sp. PAMC 21119 TaxID=1112209 RepID=UPI000287C983|nr:restriction endonuclease subunit S [Psychrobacter sp. PAMC 21119]
MAESITKYQQYAEYKDSGVEWLGKIPKEWEMWKIAHAYLEIGSGTTPPSSNEAWYVGDIPWVTTGELREKIILDTKKKVSKKTIKAFPTLRIYPVGSIAIAMYGATIGRLGILGVEATTNQACCVMSQSNVIFNKFLYYWMQAFKDDIVRLSSGGGQPNINQETVASLKVSTPRYKEQVHITNFLDHETAQIDTLIDKQQTLIQLLKEKRQAVISHAVTKGLNPDAPMKESGVEWLGSVPEGWEVLRLKHLISSLDSGCSVNAADTPAQDNEIGVLKTSCVYTRTFRVEENKTVFKEDLSRVKCPIRKGAIIISRMNTPDLVGASAIIDVDAKNIFLPDRLWQTNFNNNFDLAPEFLASFMTIRGFRNQISLAAEGASSSMQSISKEDYLSISCILPPIKEQRKIVNHIEEMQNKFNGLVNNAEQAIQLMQERRTALISAAVTGKIDVRGWVAPESR